MLGQSANNIIQYSNLGGVWKHSAPANLAPLHKRIPKHHYQLHSTPPFLCSSSRGAPQILRAGGVGVKLPPLPLIIQKIFQSCSIIDDSVNTHNSRRCLHATARRPKLRAPPAPLALPAGAPPAAASRGAAARPPGPLPPRPVWSPPRDD